MREIQWDEMATVRRTLSDKLFLLQDVLIVDCDDWSLPSESYVVCLNQSKENIKKIVLNATQNEIECED